MLFELYYVVQLFFVWSACSLVALFRRVFLGRTDNGLAELKQKWKQQLQTKYGCHVATPSELSNEPIKAENCMIGQLGDTDIFVKFVTTEQSALWWHYVMCLGYCREVRLYEFLNPYGEFAIPRLFDSKLDRWSGNYYVALSKVKNAVVRPDAEFRTFPDYIAAAKRCLTEIGKIHKHFRGKALPHWLLAQSNSSPIDGIAIYKSCFQPIVLQAYEAVKTFINREPATLIHGDFRPGNILIGNAISSSSTSTSSSGSVTIVDWFHPMRGHGLYDYVYFCCLSGNIHSEDTWQHYCNASGLNAKDPYQLEVLLVTAIEFILLCHFYFRTGIDKVFKNPDKDKNYWVDILEKYKQQIFSKKHEWSKLLKFNEIQTEQLIKELNRA